MPLCRDFYPLVFSSCNSVVQTTQFANLLCRVWSDQPLRHWHWHSVLL